MIDFLGADRPGPVLQVLNNVFLGGGDDGLDLDGTDAHIEGNLFMNFRKNTSRATTSNAIATGLPQSGETNRTQITVARNIFVDNDHAILLKEDAFATMQQNVFVDSRLAAIQFNEVNGTAVRGPGKGAELEGNIFWNNAQLFKNLVNSPTFQTTLTVDQSLLPNEVVDFGGTPVLAHSLGEGNLAGDPLFVNAAADNYRLQPESPAIGTGPAGLDMGAYVDQGPTLAGVPSEMVDASELILTVGGPGITHYRYRLNGGAYGPLAPVTDPIQLQGLTAGSYQVDVLGMNSAGEWFVGNTPAYRERSVEIIAPQRVRTGEMLPMVLRLRDSHGQIDSTLSAPLNLLNAAELSQTQLRAKKGVASASPVVTATDDFHLRVEGTVSGPAERNVDVLDASFPIAEHAGVLTGDEVWDSTVEHRITGNLRIPAGSSLTLVAGARVLLGERVNLRVEGELRTLNAIADDPIVFNSINQQQPWGGLEIVGGTADLEYTLLVNGGGDPSKAFGHSGSQPVIKVENGTVDLTNCFIINNVGKGFGSTNSRINLDQSLVSHVDTGGEFSNSVVQITNTWVKDVPSDDGVFVDDDNDGFYFSGTHSSGEASRFQDSFVITTKDDGLDHNGARLEIVRSWIEGVIHEGTADSNRNWVKIEDSVFMHNNQGVEAGYGSPDVTVTHSVIVRNDNQTDPNSPINAGLRFGDGYNGSNGDYTGHITAHEVVLYDNGDNVRNYDGTIPGPKPGAIDITQSLTNDPDYDSVPTNLTGIPVFGPRMHLLRGSAGFAAGTDGLPLGRTLPTVSAQFTVGLRGDFNLDATVDEQDIDLLWLQLRAPAPDPDYDLTGDGQVDNSDRDEMVYGVLQTTYGDADLNGAFSSEDFVHVFPSGEYEDGVRAQFGLGWRRLERRRRVHVGRLYPVIPGGRLRVRAAHVAPDLAAALAAELAGMPTERSASVAPAGRLVASAPATRDFEPIELAARQELFARYLEPHDELFTASTSEAEQLALAQLGL